MINKFLKKLFKKRLPEMLLELIKEGKIEFYYPKNLLEDRKVYMRIK